MTTALLRARFLTREMSTILPVPACLPACLSACLPAYLPAYLVPKRDTLAMIDCRSR